MKPGKLTDNDIYIYTAFDTGYLTSQIPNELRQILIKMSLGFQF